MRIDRFPQQGRSRRRFYLRISRAAGGPTTAAIGNAAAHALGARIRDLPMTRDRIMAALLKG
jgi:nicotinate dehydrogenase subunit B